ncbi:DUF3040 domain-containing protein [Streptomyces sp. NBC_00820]|uniref:DUF3040 domain-containing protein n=1 Tax=Streptomyces sp. NBC_00820 TaxID=2975842 RepID=UPI002ED13310|nr:DUF3040 domain-containing protein [Streptomyces sp. NBC_00820]
MNEIHLSVRERRILAEMEETLGSDAALARRIRAQQLMWITPPIVRRVRRPSLVFTVMGLAVVTFTLIACGFAFACPALFWGSSVTWVIALAALAVLTFRRIRPWTVPQGGAWVRLSDRGAD